MAFDMDRASRPELKERKSDDARARELSRIRDGRRIRPGSHPLVFPRAGPRARDDGPRASPKSHAPSCGSSGSCQATSGARASFAPRLPGRAGLSSGPGDYQPRRPEGEARGRPGAAAGSPPGAAGESSAASTPSPATAPPLSTPSATAPLAGVIDRVDPGRVHRMDHPAGDPVRAAEPTISSSPRQSRENGSPRVLVVTRQNPRAETINYLKIF